MENRFARFLIYFIIILGSIIFLNSSFFAIRDFEVFSQNLVPTEEYIPKEDVLGRNIFHVDIKSLASLALQHNQIKDVTIKRKLPGNLVYIVEERKPVALIKSSEYYYLVDASGFVIRRTKEVDLLQVPVITADLGAHAQAGGIAGGKEIHRVLNLLQLLDAWILARVSQVEMGPQDLTLYLVRGGYILLQPANNPRAINSVLWNILKEIEEQDLELEYIDLRFVERPVYKLK